MQSDHLPNAVVQLSSQQNLANNLHRACELAAEAASQGARLVVLPENLAYMGSDKRRGGLAQPLCSGSEMFDSLSRCAHDSKIWLIAGGVAETSHDPKRPYNTCALFGPDGRLHAKYRKIHLFDVDLPDGTLLRESPWTLAGDKVVCADIEGFRVGLSVCYDLRFPELYRKMTLMGAELLVVAAAFTAATGPAHWQVLLQARAIENQCYVLAAGQWGSHGKRSTFGHSMIVDPWGTITAQCADGPGFCCATAEKSRLQQVRRSLPALQHRRFDF